MNEIRIIIADDHPIFRSGLRGIIEKKVNLVIIAEAESGGEALGLIKAHQPDVAVLDLDMPEMDGLEVVRAVKEFAPDTKFVILTMHKDQANFNRAFEVGVSGYILKDEAAPEITRCIETVAAGREYFSPMLSAHLLNRARGLAAPDNSRFGELTPAERRLLQALAELKTSRQIAAEFNLSPRTIENQRAQLCLKLNLQGSHALIKFALEHKDRLI